MMSFRLKTRLCYKSKNPRTMASEGVPQKWGFIEKLGGFESFRYFSEERCRVQRPFLDFQWAIGP